MDGHKFVGDVSGIRRCKLYPCKEIAIHYIGDAKHQHLASNLMVCDEHAKVIYEELKETFGFQEEKKEIEDPEKKLKDAFIAMLYSCSGMLSKAKLIEFCNENNIKLPEQTEELSNKNFMELIFPNSPYFFR